MAHLQQHIELNSLPSNTIQSSDTHEEIEEDNPWAEALPEYTQEIKQNDTEQLHQQQVEMPI